MYNAHRGMPSGAPSNRLNELLDQVRAEFENQQNRSGEAEQQISTQLQEMEMVRSKIYALEQQHHQIKKQYDDEIARLRHELEARGGPSQQLGGPAGAPHHPPPPNIGNGAGQLFGTIIQPGGGQSGAGLAPPPQDHPSQQQQQQQQGHVLPPSQPGPPPGAQPMYSGYAPNGYPSQPQPNSPRSRPRGPTGPATPSQQPQPQPGYPAERSPHTMTRPTPPPAHRMPNNVGNQLADLNPELLSPHQKRDGDQWYAVFNPNVQRVLDVELMHTLQHESVVCCVRFSADGAYVATGCNRCAQIYEVSSGRQITVLQDDSVEKDGDLYIRSVCFSPDGRLLATGAEDKQIRVWDIQSKTIRQTFSGHEQDIYSLDFSRDGRHIASGSGDRSVRVWDIETGMEVLQLQIEDGVTTVAMSPDGTYVAAGSLDKSVRVWDTRNGNLVERLDGPDGHKDSVYSVAFAPSGRELVSGSLDKTIKMWELNGAGDRRGMSGHAPRGGRCIRTFEGHKDFVLSVALTPDGAWVMSGSKDRGVQFWDPSTGQAQLMLQGHKNSVISVAPSPVGPCFATGSGDMRARIWRYKPWRQ